MSEHTPNLDEITSIAVYPGIGIGRVGNSEQYYIGPEAPGQVPDPGGIGGPGIEGGTYKDECGALKRQAVRYRVYGLDAEGNAVAELTDANADVEWQVHVRNMKAANFAFRGRYLFDPALLRNPNIQSELEPYERDKLIVDPGPQTIGGVRQVSGPLVGELYAGLDGECLPVPKNLPFTSEPPADPDNSDMVLLKYRSAEVDLGRLETDTVGRLIFVPGVGKSESVTEPQVCIHKGGTEAPFQAWLAEFHDVTIDPANIHNPTNPYTGEYSYFNVPGWTDDTCGGTINATVTLPDGRTLSTGDDPTKRASVAVAPPKYSPWTYNVVSLLDLQIELFPSEDPAGDQLDPANDITVEFYRDIYPTLRTVSHYGWTSAMAFNPHGPHNEPADFLDDDIISRLANPDDRTGDPYRNQIWTVLRHGEDDNVPPPPNPAPVPIAQATEPQQEWKMPKLWGSGGEPVQNEQIGLTTDHRKGAPNQFLSLTKQQLARFKKWADGDFVPGTPRESVPLESLPVTDQPRALNHAALEPTVGGGFHPGIEITYLSRFPEWFAAPFRFTDGIDTAGGSYPITPGQVNGFMAMPWQGDFWSCNTMWWPAQRPEVVVEIDDRGRRIPHNWFRGLGIPQDASTNDNYQDGYNLMVHIWHRLGVIAPSAPPERMGGELVLAEFERDESLDDDLGLPGGSPCAPPGFNATDE